MTERERLLTMIDDLRRLREHCEPKSKENPRYHRYSLAVSALRWLVDDLERETSQHMK